MNRRLPWLSLFALLVTAAAPGRANADDGIVDKSVPFAEQGQNLVASVSFTELFDARGYSELSSGVSNTIVVRIYIYPVGKELPVAFALARIRVVYDHWDEIYTVKIDGPLGSKQTRIKKKSDVLNAITELSRFPVAPLSRVKVGPRYFLAAAVELNPVSPKLLAEYRRWLTKPAGPARVNAGSSFFGSFVSVFVNPKLPEADRVLRLRSQPFYRQSRR